MDEMNRDGGWEMESHSKSKIDDDDGDMPVDNSQAVLMVENVLPMVEEIAGCRQLMPAEGCYGSNTLGS